MFHLDQDPCSRSSFHDVTELRQNWFDVVRRQWEENLTPINATANIITRKTYSYCIRVIITLVGHIMLTLYRLRASNLFRRWSRLKNNLRTYYTIYNVFIMVNKFTIFTYLFYLAAPESTKTTPSVSFDHSSGALLTNTTQNVNDSVTCNLLISHSWQCLWHCCQVDVFFVFFYKYTFFKTLYKRETFWSMREG